MSQESSFVLPPTASHERGRSEGPCDGHHLEHRNDVANRRPRPAGPFFYASRQFMRETGTLHLGVTGRHLAE